MIDKELLVGTEVYYRLKSERFKYMHHKGFLSIYPAIIREKDGNAFKIQLKTANDIEDDKQTKTTSHYTGQIILVPYRDIVPKSKIKPPTQRKG